MKIGFITRVILASIFVNIALLPSLTSCGPSEEEIRQRQIEQDEAIRQAERQQVLNWINQIEDTLKAHNELMHWWLPIHNDIQDQIAEGKRFTETGRDQNEKLMSSMRSNLGKLYAIANTIKCPNSCWEAHQTLLKYLDKYQSELTSAISYNSMGNERDRIEANTKLNECKILREQFGRQYINIQREWNLFSPYDL